MATVSLWQRTPCLDADVAIVGGGIIGTATAWALRRLDPDLRVAVLEAERLAHGASGRNAGFLLLGTASDYASAVDAYGRDAARRIWAFTREAYEMAAEVGARHDVSFQATGSVLAAGTDAEADRLRRARALLTEDGIETSWWDPSGLDDGVAAVGFPGALFVPTGGAIDPVQLVRALAEESGAEVVTGWRAEAVEADGGRGCLRAVGGGEAVAGRVLIATNAYLPQLLPELAPLVRPVRAQMLATAPTAPCLDVPVYSHDGAYYIRQRPDGRVLVGGARYLHAEEEVGYADVTTEALQADLERYLAEHFPELAGLPVERRWSGTMGFSPDGLPTLGAVPGVEGIHVAVGFTGHGMGYALRFGLLAARTLLGRTDPAFDLFDAKRFPTP